MKLSLFEYNLPKTLIAKKPCSFRSSSKMMIVDKQTKKIIHTNFNKIIEHLNKDDVLVINNTKVINARLTGKSTEDNKNVEVLLVKSNGNNEWEVLTKPRKIFKKNCHFIFHSDLKGTVTSDNHKITIRFTNNPLLFGKTPIPPYIISKRKNENKKTYNDKVWYQTVYAKEEGSIAAPTAGLHFTSDILNKITEKGIKIAEITLHIGMGTFKPVRVDDVKEHIMDAEYYTISEEAYKIINIAKSKNRKIIAVGTSVVRTLESAFANNNKHKRQGWTSLFIYPNYNFNVVDELITNFHASVSTPFILICAFAGRNNVLKWYKEAINKQYRFLSYGDCMFIKNGI